MKKIYYIISVAMGAMISLGSCSDYLDSDYLFQDRLSIEDVFKSEDYSKEWLANAYYYLGHGYLSDVASKEWIPFNFADDMYFGDRTDAYKMWKNGEYSEVGTLGTSANSGSNISNVTSNVWNDAYKGIRQASIYIQNIHMNEEMSLYKIATTKAEARFLRAYFYWHLLRLFGPIPLLPDEGIDYTLDYADVAMPRSTYEECADFISNELLLAAKDLPMQQDQLSSARPTRGAALALRARVLLFAASPLANGKAGSLVSELVDDEGRQLLSATYDESKWAKAAAAARDVMELGVYDLYTSGIRVDGADGYPATIHPPVTPENEEFANQNWPKGWKNIDPFESYRTVFNGSISLYGNVELIFTRGQNVVDPGMNRMIIHQLPVEGSGNNTHGLTLKQCDAYYMNDGADVPGKDREIGRGDGSARPTGYVGSDAASLERYKPLMANVSLQFADREPRFYASVAYNGALWNLLNETLDSKKNQQVFYYRGAASGYSNGTAWLRTGIGVMKYIHPEDTYLNQTSGNFVKKTEPAIRYAEVLLIYAEALNELTGSHNIPSWDGSKTYTISRSTDEMKKGIHPVRIRAGLPDYSADVYGNADEFRIKLKRERQIELMAEGHRYFDLRRWMDAPVEESLPIYGFNVYATKEQRDIFHTPVVVTSLPTTFSKKMWFWPLSHTELKRNYRLTQNPGWTYGD
ncbi:RagB/SusD family nutrient uptake outer membrane protein [Bacteroidales bacterium OttesenSCG-928-A17]|nr:RagB/SusD family nutrient uptake outer membrane protein [Bacteroidales bacterium OttesenSCG-928-A17]